MDAGSVSDHAEMKFNINGVYSKGDFLFRLEYFAKTIPELKEFFERRIPWAEAQPDETEFGWETGPDGITRPVAFISATVFWSDSQVM